MCPPYVEATAETALSSDVPSDRYSRSETRPIPLTMRCSQRFFFGVVRGVVLVKSRAVILVVSM